MNILEKLVPAVSKRWLYFVAGVIWSCVGFLLTHLAYGWLLPVERWVAWLLALMGVLMAFAIYRFLFTWFADKNIRRVDNLSKDKICVFAFQQWTSYPLVAFMVALGISLRKYSPIPKSFLAVVYIGIGGGLLIASFRYYAHLLGYNVLGSSK
ncbi:MAG: hypothetical protein JRJ86_22520 [Deltaproteobacteria bacterium]|nr:hypothetical protein [Deltaproteobacteria bacterium]